MKLNIEIFKELITRLWLLIVYFRRVLQRGISHVDASISILFNRLNLVTVQIARCFVYIISMEFETSIQQSNINNMTSNTRNEESLAIKVQLENGRHYRQIYRPLIDPRWRCRISSIRRNMAAEVVFLYCDIIFIDTSGISRCGQNFNAWSYE